ncbi:replication/maintenance protein RepL [Paraclostridium bifermentans]|uniref:replication/maintenance protein RepL n=1 Tax=Paraclostridium bifermentans TaxID=1490 RepID=UPI0024328AC6|nr:replication/maintenance protein RepL [Paraclostridium bifermentans]
MSTKTTKNVLIEQPDEWVNTRTGEVVNSITIEKKVSRSNFMIVYLGMIINMLDGVGNKKMTVISYILKNMNKSTNILLITNRELAKKCNVSLDTVTKTIKLLKANNLIVTKTNFIMINPKLIHKGDAGKETALLTRFKEIEE